MRWADKASHLVEKEGPHAWHAATVVHHSRDVTGKNSHGETQSPFSILPIAQGVVPESAELKTRVLTVLSEGQVAQSTVWSFWPALYNSSQGFIFPTIPCESEICTQ